jgi:hypothetical protein
LSSFLLTASISSPRRFLFSPFPLSSLSPYHSYYQTDGTYTGGADDFKAGWAAVAAAVADNDLVKMFVRRFFTLFHLLSVGRLTSLVRSSRPMSLT